jgi:hypothetical protein
MPDVMSVRTAGILVAATIALSASVTSSALAEGPAGTDPGSNFTVGSLPSACWSDPTGAQCIDASVSYLDQARASLGQPGYAVPADFASLSSTEQAFILTNLDRTLYGLQAIPGLTQALDQDAASGVASDNDPQPSDSTWLGYTSNWAGGYQNVVLAYEGWMYDDGPGSGNLDCTATGSGGCWGHRHDILWQFGGSGALAMGAAAGADSSGTPGYAMLLEQERPGAHLTYTYTWPQALADGAGGRSVSTGSSPGTAPSPGAAGSSHPGGSGSPSTVAAHTADAGLRIERLRVHGHRVTITLFAPQAGLVRCSLDGRGRQGRRVRRSKRCGRTATFSHLPAGSYWLRFTSAIGTVSRRVLVP